ncbi:MAG: hypothetical protein HKP58_18965 [Desulfatitalea sp.]|nr:YjbH domain-containing protein [Desulfatitalea sp.]NNK02497.1 hypothetical protein [Desulfatitalea sp.]
MKKYILMLSILSMTVWACPVAADNMGDVNINGFISQGFLYSDTYNYLASDTKSGSFEYNEAGICFSKQLNDKLHLGLQLFSRDLGDASNNKITLDWAYADYRYKDWLGLRAGRIKLPFGLYNESRDMDMLRTSIVLPQGIYTDLLRDLIIAVNGAGVYGNVDLSVAGNLEYQLLAGAMNVDLDSGIGKYMEVFLNPMGASIAGTVVNNKIYAGALRWEPPIVGLLFGYSFSKVGNLEIPISLGSSIGSMASSPMSQIFSVEYTWNNLVLTAEYFFSDSGDTSVQFPFFQFTRTVKQESYYVSAAYRFVDWFTLGAYYSEFYPDSDDKDGDNVSQEQYYHDAWEKDLALTFRFDINDNWIFKIEGHAVDGTALVFRADNPKGDEDPGSRFYYGAAKLTVVF